MFLDLLLVEMNYNDAIHLPAYGIVSAVSGMLFPTVVRKTKQVSMTVIPNVTFSPSLGGIANCTRPRRERIMMGDMTNIKWYNDFLNTVIPKLTAVNVSLVEFTPLMLD